MDSLAIAVDNIPAPDFMSTKDMQPEHYFAFQHSFAQTALVKFWWVMKSLDMLPSSFQALEQLVTGGTTTATIRV